MVESKVFIDRMKGVGGHRYVWFTTREGEHKRLDTYTGVVAALPTVAVFDESFGYRRIA
jgi:hypothetical protein